MDSLRASSEYEGTIARAIAEQLLNKRDGTASDHAQAGGIPLAIVAEVVRKLVDGGWMRCIIEDTRQDVISQRLILDDGAGYALGVDLGGTKCAAALGTLSGAILAEAVEPTEDQSRDSVAALLEGLSRSLANAAGVARGEIRSVVIGIPGAVAIADGTVSLAPNLSGVAGSELLAAVEEIFGPCVALENDANLAAIGEAAQGSAHALRNFAFLALGTGIGMGLIVDGRLIRGASGAAGEIGYLPLGRNVKSADALQTGSLELDAGSAALVRHYCERAARPVLSARDVFDRLRLGDDSARETIEYVAEKIALAIVSLQATLDLEAYILGGGIGTQPELLVRVQRAVREMYARPVTIQASSLGHRAGTLGALYEARVKALVAAMSQEPASQDSLMTTT